MANRIDDHEVTLGQCIRIENSKPKHFFEAEEYLAFHVEDYFGDNERCLLLTTCEHTDMESVEFPDALMKGMKFGRLYPVKIAKRSTFIVKVRHYDGRTRVLRISKGQLAVADARANRHPECCPKKSWLNDLFD